MKAYQWLTVTAAIAITALQVWLFASASSVVSPVETQAVAAGRTGRADASGLRESP